MYKEKYQALLDLTGKILAETNPEAKIKLLEEYILLNEAFWQEKFNEFFENACREARQQLNDLAEEIKFLAMGGRNDGTDGSQN